jgi:hypothetical protein
MTSVRTTTVAAVATGAVGLLVALQRWRAPPRQTAEDYLPISTFGLLAIVFSSAGSNRPPR